MALTDTTIRNTKSTDRPFKLSDEKGLFCKSCLVAANGGGLNTVFSDLLKTLRRIEERGAVETAHRVYLTPAFFIC